MTSSRYLAGVLFAALTVACSIAPAGRPSSTSEQPRPPGPTRILVFAHRYEPTNLLPKVQQSNNPSTTTRLFSAALALIDDRGAVRPYLAESTPQLNTDSWRVLADGRMETTYRLRPGLTWHDGTPLTADDFVFALQVYKERELGVFRAAPQDEIDAIDAPDPRTVLIRWRTANPRAGGLVQGDLEPLPRRLLADAFTDYAEGRASRDAFLGNPFWTTGYVGSGPYVLDRWDPGTRLEGSAFDGHALGRAKIDRVAVRIFVDENTTLAAVLSGGQIDYTDQFTLRFEHAVTLKHEWEPSGTGTAVVVPGSPVSLYLQLRPEFAGHPAQLDLRVRRALAHAIDRVALNDGLFDGLGLPTDTWVSPSVPFAPEVERLTTHYPLDVNRSVELMGEAGFARNADGHFADASGRPFQVDFTVQASSEIERMQALLSDIWRRAGFEVRTTVMAPQLFQQLETRHTVPGLSYANASPERAFLSSEIGTAANRWSGSNRSGWVSPEYDRVYQAWNGTLDETERGRYVAQLMALISQDLPVYSLYFGLGVHTWVAALHGPTQGRQATGYSETSPATSAYWNVQDWYFG
jgi:peptide/nickel transport system substrate-binding protein